MQRSLATLALLGLLIAAASCGGGSGDEILGFSVDLTGDWQSVGPLSGNLECSGSVDGQIVASDLLCDQGQASLQQDMAAISGSGGCTAQGEPAGLRTITATVSGTTVTGQITWSDDCGGQTCSPMLTFAGTMGQNFGILIIDELTIDGFDGSCGINGMSVEVSRNLSSTGVDLTVPSSGASKYEDIPIGEPDQITLDATVQNQGTEAAVASTLLWYLSVNGDVTTSDRAWASTAVPELAPGESATVSVSPVWPDEIPFNTPGQSYWVAARADDANVVSESSESNNWSRSFNMTTRTDLDVVDVFSQMTADYVAVSNGCGFDNSISIFGELARDGAGILYTENWGDGACATAGGTLTGSHIEASYSESREATGCFYEFMVAYSLDLSASTGLGQGTVRLFLIPTGGECPTSIPCESIYSLQLIACDGCAPACGMKGREPVPVWTPPFLKD